MCLVVLAFKAHKDVPLILAANRDEYHTRPTHDAGWWSDTPDMIAGKDLEAGGTWLGVHRFGRFAAVTNHYDEEPPPGPFASRGGLVTDFLQGAQDPIHYLQSIDGADFAGFNLLVGDARRLGYLSNRGAGLRELPPGIYGLSNATLDSNWDKVETSKQRLADLLESGDTDESLLLDLLADVGDGSRKAPFVVDATFGTRCSTIVRANRFGAWQFTERRFDENGDVTGETRLSFDAVDL